MSKIKDRYFDYINSEDYENYLYGNTSASPQIDEYEVFLASQYPRSNLIRKRLVGRFKQDQDDKVKQRQSFQS